MVMQNYTHKNTRKGVWYPRVLTLGWHTCWSALFWASCAAIAALRSSAAFNAYNTHTNMDTNSSQEICGQHRNSWDRKAQRLRQETNICGDALYVEARSMYCCHERSQFKIKHRMQQSPLSAGSNTNRVQLNSVPSCVHPQMQCSSLSYRFGTLSTDHMVVCCTNRQNSWSKGFYRAGTQLAKEDKGSYYRSMLANLGNIHHTIFAREFAE